MITIFGAGGYMGSAVAAECDGRGLVWQRGRRDDRLEVLDQVDNSALVINCSAYIPLPSVDACKEHKGETIRGNVLWPYHLTEACRRAGKPLMHLSTGCLFDEQREYTEDDQPTRGWDGYCGFYVGTKLLAESVVREWKQHYILRLRLPFDEFDHPRNYLTKLTKFDRVFEHVNSLTHRGDFAKWALDLWDVEAPFGTYHCVNQGQVSAYDLVSSMVLRGIIAKPPEFVQQPGTTGARLSAARLMIAGVEVRPVTAAVSDALKNWK